MPEYAYIGKSSDEYAQNLRIDTTDYFQNIDIQ